MTNFDAIKAEIRHQSRRIMKMTPEKFAEAYMKDMNDVIHIFIAPFNDYCNSHNMVDANGQVTCDISMDCEACLIDFLNQEKIKNEKENKHGQR